MAPFPKELLTFSMLTYGLTVLRGSGWWSETSRGWPGFKVKYAPINTYWPSFSVLLGSHEELCWKWSRIAKVEKFIMLPEVGGFVEQWLFVILSREWTITICTSQDTERRCIPKTGTFPWTYLIRTSSWKYHGPQAQCCKFLQNGTEIAKCGK